MVGIGPDSNEVFDLLTQRNDISYVVGNHDLAVIAAYYNEGPPKGHHNEREHHQWLAGRINPKYISLMSSWPKTLTTSVMNNDLLFVHYHLDKDNWYAPIDKNPTSEGLDSIYYETKFSLVCFGHRHMVHHFTSNSRIYFNPGSLGCYDKPLARYGLVNISEKRMSVELLEIPYDNIEFLRSYEILKVPEREFILKVFHGDQLSLFL